MVAFVRGDTGVRFPPEMRTRAFVLWSTLAGQDAAATERLLRAEASEGDEVPTARSIRNWAKADDWAARAVASWQDVSTRNKALYDLQMAMVANKMLAEANKRDVGSGAYDDNPVVGALRLRSAELSDRAVERVMAMLRMPAPPDEGTDEDEQTMSRQEREARIVERMAQRKQGSSA